MSVSAIVWMIYVSIQSFRTTMEVYGTNEYCSTHYLLIGSPHCCFFGIYRPTPVFWLLNHYLKFSLPTRFLVPFPFLLVWCIIICRWCSVYYFNRTIEWQPLPVVRSSASPVHLRPSPIHPGAQLHLKLPAVLVQVACLAQLWAPISHSLISDKEINKLEVM